MPSDNLSDLSEWNIIVGRVSGKWDRALLKVAPFSEVAGRFAVGQDLVLDSKDGKKRVTIRSSRKQGGAFVLDCELSGEEADALKGSSVWIHPSMRPEPPEGEFYYDQLIGLRVVTEEGRDLGVIEDVLESKAHMIYVTPRAMIPGVEEIVLGVNFQTREVLVCDVPGLEGDDQRD